MIVSLFEIILEEKQRFKNFYCKLETISKMLLGLINSQRSRKNIYPAPSFALVCGSSKPHFGKKFSSYLFAEILGNVCFLLHGPTLISSVI